MAFAKSFSVRAGKGELSVRMTSKQIGEAPDRPENVNHPRQQSDYREKLTEQRTLQQIRRTMKLQPQHDKISTKNHTAGTE